MQIGPKYKIARRLGAPIFEKTQTQKYNLSLEKKTKRRSMRPRTAYGAQLIEKQKARFFYGVTEKQFKNYVKSALAKKGHSPTEELSSALETRLDNVVWRLGWATTHGAARQLVAHGHITINGKRVYTPSLKVSPQDVIGVREGSRNNGFFKSLAESKESKSIPNWLFCDAKKMEAKVISKPEALDKELIFDLGQVVEFYQR